MLRRLPYSVVYHVQRPFIYVIAVAHGSTRPGYWHGRA
jgi:hypothetical protein